MQRGFDTAEYAARLARAQHGMAEAGLSALLLTQDADIRYFSGFLTRFWESPTRPWFVILPADAKPVAVIPSIGAPLMARSWVEDIRTWPAPDPADDGVSLLADTLNEIAGRGRIGTPMGLESHLRMPLASWAAVQARLEGSVHDDSGIVARTRAVKSPAEIDKIANACAIAGRAFARVPQIASAGVPLSQVFREFQGLCLSEGADWVPYLAGASDHGGYADVISPAGDAALAVGDVLMLDTGLMLDGYFCDFDRNYSVGPPAAAVQSAHSRLVEATDRAAEIARPGVTASALFQALQDVVGDGAGGTDPGRLWHGLGMQLTEGLSLTAQDHTPLEAGMVITLEPGITLAPGRTMVHEEVIAITDGPPRYLSPRAAPEIVTL